jgi:hypothetical protein
MRFNENDVVRLRCDRPQDGLLVGAVGTIVLVYTDPPGYEVEFCDDEGGTIAMVSFSAAELEREAVRTHIDGSVEARRRDT